MADALDCRRFGENGSHFGEGGPRVALLHGWGWDGRLLEPVAQALGERCRVFLPDLPGYGMNRDRGCDSFEHCVEQLADMLPDVDTLVGWSLGGLLALAWAARAPVRKVALVGASPCFVQRPDWPDGMTMERFEAFADAVGEQPQRARMRFAALSALGDSNPRASRGAMSALIEQPPLPSSPALSQGLDWLRDQDLRDVMHALSADLMFVHGEQDRVIDVAAARSAAEVCSAHWLCVPGAAHLPWLHGGLRELCDWVAADV
jgi:pimeloyl-[acyl-carrier protein] methyl ester esterase